MSDDPFGGKDPDQEDEEAFGELRSALASALAEFADAQDVGEEMFSFLLLDAAVTQRTLAYAFSVAKPSESGLKLELDRFGRAFNDLLREAKKQAGSTLPELRDLIAEIGDESPDTQE
jgi:hypothetical protein